MEKPMRERPRRQVSQSKIFVTDETIAICSKGKRVAEQPVNDGTQDCKNEKELV